METGGEIEMLIVLILAPVNHWGSPSAGHCSTFSICNYSFNSLKNLWILYNFPHLIDEQTEAQKDQESVKGIQLINVKVGIWILGRLTTERVLTHAPWDTHIYD